MAAPAWALLSGAEWAPPLLLQAAMALMVNPPKEGDESYAQYQQEKEDTNASLRCARGWG